MTNWDPGVCALHRLAPFSHLTPQAPIRGGGGIKSTVPAGRMCWRWNSWAGSLYQNSQNWHIQLGLMLILSWRADLGSRKFLCSWHYTHSMHPSLSGCDLCLTLTQLLQQETSQDTTLCPRNHQLSILGTWLLLPCLIVLNCCLERERERANSQSDNFAVCYLWFARFLVRWEFSNCSKAPHKTSIAWFPHHEKSGWFSSGKQKSSKEE